MRVSGIMVAQRLHPESADRRRCGLKIGSRMSSACLLQVLDKSAVADAAQAYRRAFQKELRHKPTNFQRSLMALAAITAARFDAASRNPDVTAQDLSHLERVARRAKKDMLESFHPKTEPEPPPPFDEMFANG